MIINKLIKEKLSIMKIENDLLREDIRNYLNQLQDVITRMANNSKSCKQYSVTIFAAYLALIATQIEKGIENVPLYINIGMILVILTFMFIDAWYLRFERLFRNIFNSYKSKLSDCIKNNSFDEILITRLYDFNITTDYAKKENTNYCCILFSKSVFWVYFLQIAFILLLIIKSII